MKKLTLAVGDVVQIRNMDGFKPRTVSRFSGRCCVVEEIYCGRSDFNALIRIKGAEPDDEFQSVTVLVSRLVKIDQLPKGTPPKVKRYKQKHGDVFRMTDVRDADVAGTLLDLPPGERFRLEEGQSWTLVYLDRKQNHPHYTGRDGDWINEMLDAGVIEPVEPALARQFGPVATDEWSYNPTTFSELAFGEVARVIGESPAFPYVRKADTATWFYVSNQVRHVVRGWGIPVSDNGWCAIQNDSLAFKTHFRWVDMIDFTFITAFEYPAMARHTEEAFTSRLTAGH